MGLYAPKTIHGEIHEFSANRCNNIIIVLGLDRKKLYASTLPRTTGFTLHVLSDMALSDVVYKHQHIVGA